MEYCSSLLETGIRLAVAGVEVQHAIAPGNPFLDMARNDLVERFLASGADDLLFVDADVGWDAKAVLRVLSHPQEIVGGLVPKRDAKSDSHYHQNAITGLMSPEGLFQCMEIPTAFMRIKRSAFARLQKPYFKIGANPKDFGEDIYFCRRWTEAGQQMWIDSDISFSHRGGKAWRGNFYEHCLNTGMLIKQKQAA